MILLFNMAEIRHMWGVGEDRIYRAAHKGHLVPLRLKNRTYYDEQRLTATFGMPARPWQTLPKRKASAAQLQSLARLRARAR